MAMIAKHEFVATVFLFALVTAGHAQVNPIKKLLAEFGPDVEMIKAAGAKLYENEDAPTGMVETWSNPDTGGAGEVKLVEIFEHKRMPCRKLRHHARPGHGDAIRRFTITRCKTADGSWKIL